VINNPNSIFIINGKYVNFNINITEAHFDSVKYIENNKSNILCSSLIKGICSNKIYFGSGNHNIIILVTDKVGNSVQKSINFNIN
jgi:cellobiose-specific phosphotransferase system component IIC